MKKTVILLNLLAVVSTSNFLNCMSSSSSKPSDIQTLENVTGDTGTFLGILPRDLKEYLKPFVNPFHGQLLIDGQLIDFTAGNYNYYQILEVDKNATDKEIGSAFRRLTLKYHPHKWSGKDSNHIIRQLTANQQLIIKAKETLLDPVERQKYNRKMNL